MSTANRLFIAPATPPSIPFSLDNWARPQVQCVGLRSDDTPASTAYSWKCTQHESVRTLVT